MPPQSASAPGPRLIAPHRRRRIARRSGGGPRRHHAHHSGRPRRSPPRRRPAAPGRDGPAAAGSLHRRHRAGQGRDRWQRRRAEGASSPGAVICLPAGTRPNLLIRNIHGTAAAPITIRNNGGVTRITGSVPGGRRHPHPGEHRTSSISGAGVEAHCGALVPGRRPALRARHRRRPEGDQGRHREGRRGRWLRVRSRRGGPYLADDQDPRDHDPPHPGLDRQGHPRARQPRRGDPSEGIYIGSEPHNQPFAKLGKVENVEIDHNLVERSGYDGIKLKVGLGSVAIMTTSFTTPVSSAIPPTRAASRPRSAAATTTTTP